MSHLIEDLFSDWIHKLDQNLRLEFTNFLLINNSKIDLIVSEKLEQHIKDILEDNRNCHANMHKEYILFLDYCKTGIHLYDKNQETDSIEKRIEKTCSESESEMNYWISDTQHTYNKFVLMSDMIIRRLKMIGREDIYKDYHDENSEQSVAAA